jgi:lambda family phage minor tail protein L
MEYVVAGYWNAGYDTGNSTVSIVSAVQEIAPGALIELFQLELNLAQHGINETQYFHAGFSTNNYQDIVWNSQAYAAIPIEVEGFEYNGQGTLPRPKMRISNVLGSVTQLLMRLTKDYDSDGLEGAKVTRIRTLGRFLDASNFAGGNPTADPTAEFPREIYYVDRKSAENRNVVEFELASIFDMAGIRAPKRQCITRCQWVYRGEGCGYGGINYFDASDVVVSNASQDVCGKRVSSCKARFGQYAEIPFGGFPGIGTYFV